jgi:hypothetical protein
MARIDEIKRRLENWSRWCNSDKHVAKGFPSQSTFYRLMSKTGVQEAQLDILIDDALEIDAAILSLKFHKSHLYTVLVQTYARNWPRSKVAQEMRRAESTVSQNLCDADKSIQAWLENKKEISLST